MGERLEEQMRQQQQEAKLEQLQELAFSQKSVFDYGTATKDLKTKENTLSGTKEEVQLISTALESQELQLTADVRARLELRQGRNLSHVLLNSKRFFGDSTEMKDVKAAISEHEELLVRNFEANTSLTANIATLKQSYQTCIDFCGRYLSAKSTFLRSERYKTVRDKMLELMDELSLLTTIEEKIRESGDSDFNNIGNGYNLLLLAKLDSAFGIMGTGDDAATGQDSVQRQASTAQEFTGLYSTVDKVGQDIINMLRLKSTPRDIASESGSDEVDIAIYLCNLLKSFPSGIHTEYIHTGLAGYKGKGLKRTGLDENGKKVMLSTMIGIHQDKDGTLSVSVGDRKLVLPYARDAIVSSMQGNMIGNEDVFGTEFTDSARDYIQSADATEATGQLRNTCLKILSNRTGLTPTFFDNISTEEVQSLCISLIDKNVDLKDIVKYVEDTEGVGAFKLTAKDGKADFVPAKTLTEKRINGTDTLEMIRYREQHLAELAKKVEIKRQEKCVVTTTEQEAVWNKEEQSTINLIADMVFSKHTWTADGTVEEPGKRLQKILPENIDGLIAVFKDKELLSRMLDRIPLPMGKEEIKKSLGDAINLAREEFTAQLKKDDPLAPLFVLDREMKDAIYENIFDSPYLKYIPDGYIHEGISEAIKSDSVLESFEEVEHEIDKSVEEGTSLIQSYIEENVHSIFGEKTQEQEQTQERLKDPKEKGITQEEKEARIKAGADRLRKILKDSVTGETGQGKFVLLVLQNYFKGVSIIDKRSMIGAAIRSVKPMAKKPSEEQKKKSAGDYIGGIFKGAGPLLQKILQGIPSEGMPEELKGAFEDVKSSLLPIPEEIVEAQMLAMVKRSNGEVTKIEVARSLGAASVGQAFLCKLFGPSFPDTGEEVVIKLLRPDVRNRMMREKEILLRCAEQTDAGMRKTYEGQLARIEEELDLTIEARNVERGQIYSKPRDMQQYVDTIVKSVFAPEALSEYEKKQVGEMLKKLSPKQMETLNPYVELDDQKQVVLENGIPKFAVSEKDRIEFSKIILSIVNQLKENDGVVAMRVNSVIAPTTTSMVIDKAPGITVDKYLKDLSSRQTELLAPLFVRDDQNRVVLEDGIPRLDFSKVGREDLYKITDEIYEMGIQANIRQEHLIRLSEKWVDEGLFKSGFYHGDLHAGNIMITDDMATVIDFGNATQIDDDQKVYVTRMMMAAAVGDATLFGESFHELMSKDDATETHYKEHKAQFFDMLKEVLSMGDTRNSGERIGVALIKAQELGLELPPAIYNFSQCQLRLQNTIDSLNTQIESITKVFPKLVSALNIKPDDQPGLGYEIPYFARLQMGTTKETGQLQAVGMYCSFAELIERDLKDGSNEDIKFLKSICGGFFELCDKDYFADVSEKIKVIKAEKAKVMEERAAQEESVTEESATKDSTKRGHVTKPLSQALDDAFSALSLHRGFSNHSYSCDIGFMKAYLQGEHKSFKNIPKDLTESQYSDLFDYVLETTDAKMGVILGKIIQLRNDLKSGTEENAEIIKWKIDLLANIFYERIRKPVSDQERKRDEDYEKEGITSLRLARISTNGLLTALDEINTATRVAPDTKKEMLTRALQPYLELPGWGDKFKAVIEHRCRPNDPYNPLWSYDVQMDINALFIRMIAKYEDDKAIAPKTYYELSQPKDFLEVMANVILGNFKSTVSRMGAVWSAKHAKEFKEA